MILVTLLHVDHRAIPGRRNIPFFLNIVLNLAVILQHLTQRMDAPDVVWSDNHLLYYAVRTEPAQLLTCRNKCSQEKHHFSKKSLHAKSASSILHITCTYVDMASIRILSLQEEYARADIYIAINMELNVLVHTIYLIHYNT